MNLPTFNNRNSMKYVITVLVFVTTCLWTCQSYKILAVFPVPARSHHAINSKIFVELAKRGHEVTAYTPYLQETPVENLKEVPLTSLIKSIGDRPCVTWMFSEGKTDLSGLENRTPIENAYFYYRMGYVVAQEALRHENIQKLLHSNEEYDLILLPQFVTDSLLGIADHFKKPLVLVATMPLFPWSSFILSHPSPSSYVPNLLSPYSGTMDFWQRLTNSFYDAYTILYHRWKILPQHRELVKQYIPGQPDLYDFLNNSSLVLINTHVSINEAMLHVPNAIEVGGIHIEEPKKLPEDLQKFLDESVDGVILFAMGSNLRTSELGSDKLQAFMNVFSKIKQNVLWKWETDSLPGHPKNVKLMKWIPQADVLAHPNVKAFINHGGLLSIMESVYHAVPFIGIPFFGDHKMDMAIAEFYEYGIELSYKELNEEKLTRALNEVLNNPKYKNNIKQRSKILRDQPMEPLDTAIYWIEYVLRHQGAPHLKYPGMNLAWYQRNLLDVIAFILIGILIVIFMLIFVCTMILKLICKPYDAKKKKKD